MKIIAFGEILFDVIDEIPHLGGAPLNFAAHLAKCGWESYMYSCVGQDVLGSRALREIRNLGVDTTFIQTNADYPTGTVAVLLKGGQPDYTINQNVAYDFIEYRPYARQVKEIAFDVLYLGTLAQRRSNSAKALKQLVAENNFRHIFYDVNLRKNSYSKEVIHHSLQVCSILKLNDGEVEVLAEMFYRKDLALEDLLKEITTDFDIEIIVVTVGGKGCWIYRSDKLVFIKAVPVEVVDTIGAGDAFSAAFVFQYLIHADVQKAGEVAACLGAYVAGARGAIPAYSPEIKKVLGL